MGRFRALVIATLFVVVGTAVPAAAQTPPSSTPDAPPDTTVDSTPPTDPSTTVPTDPTTVPPDTTPAPPTTQDPNTDEDAPPASVPVDPATIPARPPPAAPGVTLPPPAHVVQIDVQTARAQALARQAAYNAAAGRVTELQASMNALQDKVNTLAVAQRQAIQNLTAAHADLVQRAVDAYIRGDTEVEQWTSDEEQSEQRTALLGVVADRDQASVNRYEAARAQVTRDQADTSSALLDTQTQLTQATADVQQAQLDLNSAQLEVAVTSAGGNIVIHGFVFPVASPHTFSEDFGDPRLPGTPNAHFHQGCDVLAAEGTELYAAERGVITQLSGGGLGGTGIWLKGESGTYYYYAHLSAYVDGLAVGQVVEAGQLIGYVGQTGDATGPHLHFEVHPGGGPAIDPYPLLLAADPQPTARP